MMKNNSWIAYLILTVVLILAILFTKWVYQAVMATDWPDWVKYLILH